MRKRKFTRWWLLVKGRPVAARPVLSELVSCSRRQEGPRTVSAEVVDELEVVCVLCDVPVVIAIQVSGEEYVELVSVYT